MADKKKQMKKKKEDDDKGDDDGDKEIEAAINIPEETDPLLPQGKKEKEEDSDYWSTENIKERVHYFWEYNFYVNTFVLCCILVSCVMFCFQTIHSLMDYHIFFILEIFFVTVFTAELLGRFWSSKETTCTFCSGGMNIIDLMAILPFYIEVILISHDYDLRVLRVLRLIRIFKFGRHSDQLNMIGNCMLLSKSSFVLLGFMLSLAMIIFSTMMFIMERGDKWDKNLQCYVRHDNLCSPFQSIPGTFWWAITTMTTVGYGDTYPITETGKAVGGLTMVMGLLCVALPTTVLGVQFSDAFETVTADRELAKMKARIKPENIAEEKKQNIAAIQHMTKELDILIPDLMVHLEKLAQRQNQPLNKNVATIFSQEALHGVHKLSDFIAHC